MLVRFGEFHRHAVITVHLRMNAIDYQLLNGRGKAPLIMVNDGHSNIRRTVRNCSPCVVRNAIR